MTVPDKQALIEARINRVLTQYRESPKLLHMVRTYLGQVADVTQVIAGIPDYFDLDTALGEQLTFLGKRVGWPRAHCVCRAMPTFGFDCEVVTPPGGGNPGGGDPPPPPPDPDIAPEILALSLSNTEPQEGQTVSAIPTVTGKPVPTLAYQWQRGTGSTFTSIAGATLATYTVTNADANNALRVIVTATNRAGSDQEISAATSVVPGTPTVTPTTLNPSDRGSGVVLSNGNLTAASTAGDNHSIVRATTSRTSGKYYFEVKLDSSDNDVAAGVANSSLLLDGSIWLGGSNNAVGAWFNDQQSWINGAGSPAWSLFSQNNIGCVAVDFDAKKIWFRRGSEAWDQSSTDNPATGAGGRSFSVISGPYFPAVQVAAGTVTVNFGASAFAYAAPSGFKAWNEATATTPPTGGSLTYTTAQVVSTADGETISNKHIDYSGAGPAVRITHKNVILKNCLIEHQQAQGVYVNTGGANSNVVIDNVEVILVGGPTGVNPVDNENKRSIEFENAPYGTVQNSTVSLGACGVMFKGNSHHGKVLNVECYNLHGRPPGSGARGQFVQFNASPDGLIDTFYVLNPIMDSYTEDLINGGQSPRCTIRNGLIDGCNSPSGWGVLMEFGSDNWTVTDVTTVRMSCGSVHSLNAGSTCTRVTNLDGYSDNPHGRGPASSGHLNFDGGSSGLGLYSCRYGRMPNPHGGDADGLYGNFNPKQLTKDDSIPVPSKPTTVSHFWNT